ncbi:MAG TPA: hypothetical protein PLN44_04200 [Syntrophales bacterium]|nr:hypothetical protein [Syntrophales bacterium]HOM07003.1 hypothetical protein [Syntrophales bacterium]HON99597.1 hypothetical protein [Syntrophales bacterium]HPQ06772.1 hypothetical protein [Syntrophales bacterium]
MKKRSFSSFFVFLLLAALAVGGCHRASGVTTQGGPDKGAAFKRIAVLPFQDLSPDEYAALAVAAKVPISSLKGESSPGVPARIVQDLFWERLAAKGHFDLVSTDRTAGILSQVIHTDGNMGLPEGMVRIGRQLEADGVLVGYVYRFRERKGYDYGVEKPASVAFEVQLFRCRDGDLVWKATFDKTQTSLMENMLQISNFVKDRGRWITARELAAEGVEEVLKRFPVPAPQSSSTPKEKVLQE